MSSSGVAASMRQITKRFPGVIANDRVDLELREGEIHTLLGENGAGKSTLMNVLTGIYLPDGGTLSVWGEPVQLRSPKDAIALPWASAWFTSTSSWCRVIP
jgi:simple sugar transport system ATP-binding protein